MEFEQRMHLEIEFANQKLTKQEADIVHLEKFNEDLVDQVIGLTQRLGEIAL